MFTGLVQTTGTVLSLEPSSGALRVTVAAPDLAGKWQVGDSIAVNGVCLTAIATKAEEGPDLSRFSAELADETIRRTSLSRLIPGSLVNLELPTLAGSRLGGHVVQGHVDGTGRLVAIVPLHSDLNRTDWRLTVEISPELAAQVIPQGSITIDGISLTVAAVHENQVEIAVIPHTYRATNLHSLLTGAEVNIETDVLSKYAARRASLGGDEGVINHAWLAAHPKSEREVGMAEEGSAGTTHDSRNWLTGEYLLASGY